MTSLPARAATLAALWCCVSLSACGSSSTRSSGAPAKTSTPTLTLATSTTDPRLPAATVAQVGPYSITKHALEHLMSIVIVTDGNDIPKTLEPKRVVPQPPAYTACVAHVKEGTAATNSHQPVAAVKEKCAQLRQALAEQALESLISTDQLVGLARERGITANNSEARRLLHRLKREEFPSETTFRRYLHFTHQSLADQYWRLREDILADKLRKSIISETNQPPTAAQQRELAQAKRKWIAATRCRPGYIISLCNNYRPTASKPPAPNTLIAELGL